MTCPDCTKALEHAAHCGYTTGCHGCTARAIARCLDAFNALHADGRRAPADRDKLRALVERLMKDVEPLEARKMVMEWWRRDRQRSTA